MRWVWSLAHAHIGLAVCNMWSSSTEAFSYVLDVLKVLSPVSRMEEDPYSLLDEIIKAFHASVPFQSVSLISVEPKHRTAAVLHP